MTLDITEYSYITWRIELGSNRKTMHTYPCGQVYGFDRREGVARPESKHQIIISFTVLILGDFFPNRRSPSIWESAYGPAITTTTRHWWSAGQRRTQSEDGPEFILAIICMDTAYSLMLARGLPQAGARCSLLCRCSGHLSSVAGLSSRACQKIDKRDRAGRGG